MVAEESNLIASRSLLMKSSLRVKRYIGLLPALEGDPSWLPSWAEAAGTHVLSLHNGFMTSESVTSSTAQGGTDAQGG